MTHLIIHQNLELRRAYLLEQINKHLQRDFSGIAELHRVPDIHIVEMTEKSSIGIDEIKKLQKEMIFQPFQEIYQVGIIFHADSLTHEAQNSLLKTLEEGGERSIYFLESANEKNLLDTIVSRSIKHYVKSSSSAESNGYTAPDPEVFNYSLIERFQYVDSLVSKDKEDSTSVKQFFAELTAFLHGKFTQIVENDQESHIIREFIKKVDEANFRINANVNKQLALENVMLEIPKELLKKSPSA